MENHEFALVYNSAAYKCQTQIFSAIFSIFLQEERKLSNIKRIAGCAMEVKKMGVPTPGARYKQRVSNQKRTHGPRKPKVEWNDDKGDINWDVVRRIAREFCDGLEDLKKDEAPEQALVCSQYQSLAKKIRAYTSYQAFWSSIGRPNIRGGKTPRRKPADLTTKQALKHRVMAFCRENSVPDGNFPSLTGGDDSICKKDIALYRSLKQFCTDNNIVVKQFAEDIGLRFTGSSQAGKKHRMDIKWEDSLAAKRPRIAEMLHSNQEECVSAELVSPNSNVQVRVRCSSHPAGVVMSLPNITRYTDEELEAKDFQICKYCTGHALSDDNNLKAKYPDLVESLWDLELNKKESIFPEELMPNDNQQRPWWKCHMGIHESYRSTCNAKVNGSLCPCCGKKQLEEQDSLFAVFPDIAKHLKAGEEKAKAVFPKSHLVETWICSFCTGVFEQAIYARVNNEISKSKGCPECSHRIASTEYNLQVSYPDLAKEYHEDNVVPVGAIVPGSHEKRKWRCSDCSHVWHAQVKSRALNEVGCPECNRFSSKGEKAVVAFIQGLVADKVVESYETQTKVPGERLASGYLKYDCYFKFIGRECAIEFDGVQHFGPSYFGRYLLDGHQSQVLRDRRKDVASLRNGIALLRIDYNHRDKVKPLISEFLRTVSLHPTGNIFYLSDEKLYTDADPGLLKYLGENGFTWDSLIKREAV